MMTKKMWWFFLGENSKIKKRLLLKPKQIKKTHTATRNKSTLFSPDMPVTEAEFTQAAEDVKRYKQCTNDEQLELYGWYKQATIGDCTTERPGMFDLKGKAKWDAWKSREGSGKGTAMDEYCKVVAAIKAKYDDDA